MGKMIPTLSSVAIMAVLSLRQRLFLVQSDTGRQWAVMAIWFGLCDWFPRSPQARLSRAASPQPQRCRHCAPHVSSRMRKN